MQVVGAWVFFFVWTVCVLVYQPLLAPIIIFFLPLFVWVVKKKTKKGLTYDEIRTSNFPLAELFTYGKTALEVKIEAKQRREAAVLKEAEEARAVQEKAEEPEEPTTTTD